MPFECPVCQSALNKSQYEGSNTYPCSNNCGVFLSRKSLRIIEEAREQSISMSSVPNNGDDKGSPKSCPKCKTRMAKKNYGELSSTIIDYCTSCQGMWLDPGELERIQVFYEAANDFKEPPKKDETEPGFACPKCATEQTKKQECIQCGVIFNRYKSPAIDSEIQQKIKQTISSELEATFKNLQHLEVDQKFHLTEVMINIEHCNEYKLTLFPPDARKGTWRIEEQNVSAFSFFGRNLFGFLYTSTMHLLDSVGNIALRFHRKPRLYFHELEVYDENGVEFGRVKREFSYFHRVLSVENNKGTRQLKVVGPIWSPWTFQVYSGRKKVGVITKEYSGLLMEAYTDADKFKIEFTGPLNNSKKRLSVAALMLIDSLYFEGEKSYFSHFMSAPGISVGVFLTILVWISYYQSTL